MIFRRGDTADEYWWALLPHDKTRSFALLPVTELDSRLLPRE